MLSATVSHICLVLGEPQDKIAIRNLLDIKLDLQRHLKERGLRRNTVRSYSNFVRILLQKARGLGWNECTLELKNAWEETRLSTSKLVGCSEIIRYAIRNGIEPGDFTESDLTKWAGAAVQNGRRHEYIVQVKAKFRKRIFQAGLGPKFPHLLRPRTGRIYGVPASKFPEPLRWQVRDLLRWKSAEFASERPIRAKNRAITIISLEGLLSRMFGFLVSVKKKPITELRELLSKSSVIEYVDWAINTRAINGKCVWVELGRIGGLRAFPGLGGHDFTWLPSLMAQLPREPGIGVRERNDRNWVPHSVLLEIPDQIRKDTAKAFHLSELAKAEALRNALLMALMTALPWRQRNYRECKLLPLAEGGNLSKEEIPPNSTIAKPPWVLKALRENPHQRFWQFHFRPAETKTNRGVRGILPRQLIPVLEEYLDHHRGVILRQHPDPDTLFCTRGGHPLSRNDVLRLVGAITMKYSGRRVNPHLFRHIFAVQWLEDHPEDYLTLAKILWHSNVSTTIKIYGRNFDESYGARAAEEWLEEKTNRSMANTGWSHNHPTDGESIGQAHLRKRLANR